MKEFAWDVREQDIRRVLESHKKDVVMQEAARLQQRVLLQKDRLRDVVLQYRGEDKQGEAARSVIEDILLEEKEIQGSKRFYLPAA